MENAYGLLPNDRTHQIKAFGFYEVTPEWQVGANLLMASGRPKNCIGYYSGTSPTQHDVDYGASYRYCNGKPAPRGSEGNLPWDKRLDLSLAYKPSAFKGLQLKADVTNVFNTQVEQTIDEVYNNNVDDAISGTYGRTISTTTPRSVRLTATYNYKF
jgi:outer membrane receptor protein involved in Fe transport